jgi:hypothetical protein
MQHDRQICKLEININFLVLRLVQWTDPPRGVRKLNEISCAVQSQRHFSAAHDTSHDEKNAVDIKFAYVTLISLIID